MQVTDIVAGAISSVLTIMVLSYLIGDNPLFRLAVSIFVGVSAGYVAAVALRQVLIPQLVTPLMQQQNIQVVIIPLLLALLMTAKAFPRLSNIGSPAMAFMVGIGAAVAIAGAMLGTLVPQFLAAIEPFDLTKGQVSERLFEGSVMAVGTISTLAYFHFGVKQGTGQRNPVVSIFALVGQVFIAITFGVLFAGAYAASVTALIERLYFIKNFVISFF